MDATHHERGRAATVCGALKHPMRVRILEILNEGPRSPSQFVEEGLVPKELYTSYTQALSLASYHFRELAKEGCLEVAEVIPRRGAFERVYRGKARVYFTDAEFAEMQPDERRQFSRISFQGLVARVDGAIQADTFDSRADRHLTWMPMQLDERGWQEMMEVMAACFGDVEQIRHDSKRRLEESDAAPVPVTFGMLGFESPPPPPQRRD